MSSRGGRLRRWVGKAAWTLTDKARLEPFELFLAALVLVSGVDLLVQKPQDALSILLPHWLLTAWATALVIGGGLTCIGMFRKGYAAELAGLTLLAWTAPAYALIIFYFVGLHGALSIAIILGFSAACGWRAHTTAQAIRALRKSGGMS